MKRKSSKTVEDVKSSASVRHFELTGEARKSGNATVYRIRATRNLELPHGFTVAKGDIGGFVESVDNLRGNAWVAWNAVVKGSAFVTDRAHVGGDAVVSGHAEIHDEGFVSGSARISGSAKVFERGQVCGKARICGHATIHGSANVCDHAVVDRCAEIYDMALVGGHAHVTEDARVFGGATVTGRTVVGGSSRVHDDVYVYDNARIGGEAVVGGHATISKDAEVMCSSDYGVYRNTWSSFRYVTYTRSNGLWKAGCFVGTGDELVKKAKADGKLSGKCYAAIVKCQKAIDEEMKTHGRVKADREAGKAE